MINTNAPDPLWEFCIVTKYEIVSRMSGGVPRTDLEVSTGESVDISE